MATNQAGSPVTPLNITDAGPPFNDPKGDVILRSSDHVDFRVLKAFLAYASPVFESMFSLPQPEDRSPEEFKDGLPVVPIEKWGSKAIRTLLLFCYPVDTPPLKTTEEVMAVMEPARMYCMEGVERRVRAALLTSPLTQRDPLRIFAVAVRYRWQDIVSLAAKNVLHIPIHKRQCVEELKHINGLDYHRLLEYQWECGEAASKVAGVKISRFSTPCYMWIKRTDFIWFTSGPGHPQTCSSQQIMTSTTLTAQKWWVDYMIEIGIKLADRPRGSTVMDRDVVDRALQKANICSICRMKAFPEMDKFLKAFSEEVERVISQVALKVIC